MLEMRDPVSVPGSGRFPAEENGSPLQYSQAPLVAQKVKESACNVGDLGLSPAIGMIPTAKSLDRRAWWATVHTVAQS